MCSLISSLIVTRTGCLAHQRCLPFTETTKHMGKIPPAGKYSLEEKHYTHSTCSIYSTCLPTETHMRAQFFQSIILNYVGLLVETVSNLWEYRPLIFLELISRYLDSLHSSTKEIRYENKRSDTQGKQILRSPNAQATIFYQMYWYISVNHRY